MSLFNGRKAEQQAEEYLQQQGLVTIAKNFYCASGEIDLIMKSENELVFVEVRSRKNKDFGSAAETVDKRKQKKIITSAKVFLHKNSWSVSMNCRFDIIEVQTDDNNINWIQDAFTLGNQFSVF
jgi:putative endonuclease